MKHAEPQHERNLGQVTVSSLTHMQTLIPKSFNLQDFVDT